VLPFPGLHIGLGRMPKVGAVHEPRHEVQTLRSAEWAGGAAMLTGAALFSGFYLNELLMRLVARHDAHPALFDVYAETLPTLGARDDAQVQAVLRAFEISVLKEIGVLPDLSLVTSTQAELRANERYTLLPEAGVAATRGGETDIAGRALIDLQAALEHGSLAALQQACASALPELKAMLRSLLHYHLGSPLLRTRQVMLDVQALANTLP